jgi:hypothetical protein
MAWGARSADLRRAFGVWVTARLGGKRGWIGLTAGFVATLSLAGGAYGALVAANSRVALDFAAPKGMHGVDDAARVVAQRLDKIDGESATPVLPSLRRLRAPFIREGAERAVAQAEEAQIGDLRGVAGRAAASLRADIAAIEAERAPLESEALLAQARGAAWGWALLLAGADGPAANAPALDAALDALRAAGAEEPAPFVDAAFARAAMTRRLKRAADLLTAISASRLPSPPS